VGLTSRGGAYAQQQAANNLWLSHLSSVLQSKKGYLRTNFAHFGVLTNWATIDTRFVPPVQGNILLIFVRYNNAVG
jgi:hypothetical protein